MSLLFLIVDTFLINTLPIFFYFFTCAYTEPAYFVKFSSLLVLVSTKSHHLAFIVYSFQGIKHKIKKHDGGIPTLLM